MRGRRQPSTSARPPPSPGAPRAPGGPPARCRRRPTGGRPAAPASCRSRGAAPCGPGPAVRRGRAWRPRAVGGRVAAEVATVIAGSLRVAAGCQPVVGQLVDRVAAEDAVAVGQVLAVDRRPAGQPGGQQPAEGRVELDGVLRHRRAEHQVGEARSVAAARRSRPAARRGGPARSGDGGPAPSCRGGGCRSPGGPGRSPGRRPAGARGPSPDLVRRLAPRQERLGRLAPRDHAPRRDAPAPRPGPPRGRASPASSATISRAGRVRRSHQADSPYATATDIGARAISTNRMLWRCVRQAIRNTYPSAASPSTRRRGRSSSATGRNSRNTGPNWCEKLSNRSGWSVSGTSAVSRFHGGHRHRPLDRVEDLVQPGPAEGPAEERIDGVTRVDISTQIPPAPGGDRGRRIDQCQPQPGRPGSRRRRSASIAGSSGR